MPRTFSWRALQRSAVLEYIQMRRWPPWLRGCQRTRSGCSSHIFVYVSLILTATRLPQRAVGRKGRGEGGEPQESMVIMVELEVSVPTSY